MDVLQVGDALGQLESNVDLCKTLAPSQKHQEIVHEENLVGQQEL